MANWKETLEPYVKVHESVKEAPLNPRAGTDLIVGAVIISDRGPSIPTLVNNQREFLSLYAAKDISKEYTDSLDELYVGGGNNDLASTMWLNCYRLAGSGTLLVSRAGKLNGITYAKPLAKDTRGDYIIKEDTILKAGGTFKFVIDAGNDGVSDVTSASDGWAISIKDVGVFGNRVNDNGPLYDYYVDNLYDLVLKLNETPKFYSPDYEFFEDAKCENKIWDPEIDKYNIKCVRFNTVFFAGGGIMEPEVYDAEGNVEYWGYEDSTYKTKYSSFIEITDIEKYAESTNPNSKGWYETRDWGTYVVYEMTSDTSITPDKKYFIRSFNSVKPERNQWGQQKYEYCLLTNTDIFEIKSVHRTPQRAGLYEYNSESDSFELSTDPEFIPGNDYFKKVDYYTFEEFTEPLYSGAENRDSYIKIPENELGNLDLENNYYVLVKEKLFSSKDLGEFYEDIGEDYIRRTTIESGKHYFKHNITKIITLSDITSRENIRTDLTGKYVKDLSGSFIYIYTKDDGQFSVDYTDDELIELVNHNLICEVDSGDEITPESIDLYTLRSGSFYHSTDGTFDTKKTYYILTVQTNVTPSSLNLWEKSRLDYVISSDSKFENNKTYYTATKVPDLDSTTVGCAYIIPCDINWYNESQSIVNLNGPKYSGFEEPSFLARNLFNSRVDLKVRIRRFNHNATAIIQTEEGSTDSPYQVIGSVLDVYTNKKHSPHKVTAQSILYYDFYEFCIEDPSISSTPQLFNVGNVQGRGDITIADLNDNLTSIHLDLPQDLGELGLDYYDYDCSHYNSDPLTEIKVNAKLANSVTGTEPSDALLKVNDADIMRAYDRIELDERYQVEGLTDCGCTEPIIQNYVANIATQSNYFYPASTTPSTNYMVIANKKNKVTKRNSNIYWLAPYDLDDGTVGYLYNCMSSVLYWEVVFANRRVNLEFAAAFGENRGIASVVNLAKEFNKEERQLLLTKKINSIFRDVYLERIYINDNYTAQEKENIWQSENIVRLRIRISKSIPKLLSQFRGRQNNQKTWDDVCAVINYWIKTEVMNYGETIADWQVICDENLNPPEEQRANRLNVVVNIRHYSTVKYIEVYHKSYPIGIEFDSMRG